MHFVVLEGFPGTGKTTLARYCTALAEIHKELGEWNVERVYTDSDSKLTLEVVLAIMKKGSVFRQ